LPQSFDRYPALVAVVLLAFPTAAQASEDVLSPGDTAWILVSTALVLFMTIPGLALFYGGLVRTKNVLSVLTQCLALTSLMTVVWLVAGYSLAFDTAGMESGQLGRAAFVGTFGKAFLSGVDSSTLAGSIPEVLFFAFQMTFAIITPALMIGAFVERITFVATLVFSSLWLLLVYVPICHMTWAGDGALFADLGVFDFAGGIVVHITAGVGALVACIVIGPRREYGSAPIFPHNLTMTVTGTAMLWVGWFGFNGGSALAANGDAAMAITVTHISAAVATLTWMAMEWIRHGKPSALGMATGSIAGLAAVTPASGFVGPLGGFCIGAAAGLLCFLASTNLKNRLGYDDSLDVFGVHGVGGFVGIVLVALFAAGALGGKQGDLAVSRQLAVQFGAGLGAAIYTAIATFVILKIVGALTPLRVTDQQENEGLDLVLHDEAGYRL